MLDLAQLATDITPGTWEVTQCVDESGWWIFNLETSIGGELLAGHEEHLSRIEANATAMTLVPDLIAEVLRLREENEQQKDQLHGFMVLTKPGEMQGDRCYRGGCKGTLDYDAVLGSVFCPVCGAEWEGQPTQA